MKLCEYNGGGYNVCLAKANRAQQADSQGCNLCKVSYEQCRKRKSGCGYFKDNDCQQSIRCKNKHCRRR